MAVTTFLMSRFNHSRGMGEKPSPLPACAEALAGRGEDFGLIIYDPKLGSLGQDSLLG